jgi:hypothetical protein
MEASMNRSRDVEYEETRLSKPGSDVRKSGEGTPVMKGKPQQPSQSEKGDARRRDPRINKNSQAQQDDQRDNFVEQGLTREKDPQDTDRDTRDAEGKEALRHQVPPARRPY